jgi:hypothetical protein
MVFRIVHSAVRSHLHPPPPTLNQRFPSSAERVSRGESVGQRCGNDTVQRFDMPCVTAQLSHCLVSRRQLTILQCYILLVHKLQMIHCKTVSCSPYTTDYSRYLIYFIYISVLNATYSQVTLLPHYTCFGRIRPLSSVYLAKIVALYVKITYRV